MNFLLLIIENFDYLLQLNVQKISNFFFYKH